MQVDDEEKNTEDTDRATDTDTEEEENHSGDKRYHEIEDIMEVEDDEQSKEDYWNLVQAAE